MYKIDLINMGILICIIISLSVIVYAGSILNEKQGTGGLTWWEYTHADDETKANYDYIEINNLTGTEYADVVLLFGATQYEKISQDYYGGGDFTIVLYDISPAPGNLTWR
ncbi:MAG: hypothetical protein CVT90_01555 [Candidatus Altiarchaeales archaeon HGW-Altiarchaeales-3]|nr:MAG: hypothetical protein CVT90_01555 [Candidatus Altiarchaeales archaeon HGW-Altiarchaeales-3]